MDINPTLFVERYRAVFGQPGYRKLDARGSFLHGQSPFYISGIGANTVVLLFGEKNIQVLGNEQPNEASYQLDIYRSVEELLQCEREDTGRRPSMLAAIVSGRTKQATFAGQRLRSHGVTVMNSHADNFGSMSFDMKAWLKNPISLNSFSINYSKNIVVYPDCHQVLVQNGNGDIHQVCSTYQWVPPAKKDVRQAA